MSTILTSLDSINSTTYVDLLAVLMGLERLPGEAAVDFHERLLRSTRMSRGHEYAGVLNEISLQLGLGLKPAISLVASPESEVSVDISGVTLINTTETITSKLQTIDQDDAWSWRMLSDVVADINLSQTFTATLLVTDAPALQIARQSNTFLVVAQELTGRQVNLEKTGVLVGTERFSVPVSSYTLATDGQLIFAEPVPDGTTITYEYRVWPYDLVGSEVGLIGLLEPSLPSVAEGPNGRLVYQLREVVQTLMDQDRSYWSQ